MKIVYLLLKNHIPFKRDIELDLQDNNDIIMLKGRTGAGKSYLINCLHPMSVNNRHWSNYSIFPNKHGYKKIIYRRDDGVTYEIIHEYTPNKNGGHSCKSYISEVDIMGNKKELNPTGHNDVFKELIKVHLKYDTSRTPDFAYLHSKSSAFIDCTPEKRLTILFDLIKNEVYRNMEKALKTRIDDNNARLKMFKEMRDGFLSKYNIAECTSNIRVFESDLQNTKVKLNNLTNDLITIRVDKGKFEKDSVTYSHDQIKEFKLFAEHSKIKGLTTISEAYTFITNRQNEITKLVHDVEKEESDIESINNNLERIYKLEEYERDLINYKGELLNIKSSIEDMYIITPDTPYQSKVFTEILGKLSMETEDLNRIGVSYTSLSFIRETYISNSKTIKQMEETLTLYKDAFSRRHLLESESKCHKCGTEIKIIEHLRSILNKNINVQEYESKIKHLTTENKGIESYVSFVKSQRDNIIRTVVDLKPLYKDIIGLMDEDRFFTFVLNIDSREGSKVIEKAEGISRYGISTMQSAQDNIKNLEMHIHNIKQIGDINGKEGLETSKRNKVKYIEQIKEKIQRLHNTMNINVSKNIELVMNQSIEEVLDLCSKYLNLEKSIDFFDKTIKDKEYEIQVCEDRIKQITNDIAEMEKVISDYDSANKHFLSLQENKKLLDDIRVIINKDIPCNLLDNNLQYIEANCNRILAENSIPYTVLLKVNDKETGIDVPMYVNEGFIPDAKSLSSGETSFISLLINSTLLSLLGYKVLTLDEMDAHIDTMFRTIYGSIVSSIRYVLDIDQVFIISHNLDLSTASTYILVGDIEDLTVDIVGKKVIRVNN
ncbi:MAG: hypothetical protein ACRC92_20500 [Peptostreptococcaceae bacterium]